MKTAMTRSLLAAALGLALAAGASAQTAPTPAQQKELDAARAALDQAAQRYAELARKYDVPGAPVRIEKRMLRKPVVGVLLAPDDKPGVRIAGVTPDSAAAAAGLKTGDRITRIDGRRIDAVDGEARLAQAREWLGALDGSRAVALGYERDGAAREVSLTPKVADRLMILPGMPGAGFDGNVQVFRSGDGDIEVLADRIQGGPPPHWDAAIAPDVRHEIIRLDGGCKGDDCKLPALAEAFRWNGLNLAAVDAGLGRYFGTDKGALVLSTGKDLQGLEAGDVVRMIDGKQVAGPRDVMEALRARKAGEKVAVEFLRDKATRRADIAVPEALPFKLPAPGMGEHRKMVFVGGDGQVQVLDGAGGAPRAGMPKVVARDGAQTIVIVDKDGKTRTWEGKPGDTPPAWVQALPQDGRRVEKRVQVIVDDKGHKTIVEDEEALPPPPPPAPPAPPKGD